MTTDELIASARRRGHLTRAAGTLSTADLVDLATEELQTYLVGFLISLTENYLVADYNLTLTAGTAEYRMPPRSIGGKARMVLAQTDGGQYRRITEAETERILHPPTDSGSPAFYYWAGSKIGFSPCGGGNIRIQYFRKPNRLVLEEDAAQITAINTGTKTVTVTGIPLAWGSDTYDFISVQTPFDALAEDASATVAGSNITFANALPSDLQVGDWVALAGESPLPQIPEVLHPLLAQRTAAKALESLDAKSAAALSKVALDEEKRAAHLLVNNRGAGSPRYIINRNGPGWRYGGRVRY